MINNQKLLVICGPTATGKTSLGIELAKKFNGEVVSADSRQVYKEMDIGTGKDIGNVKCQMSNVKSISNDKLQIGYYEIEGVKVWLYDVVEPDYRFSVADWVKCAEVVIKDIWGRGKLPILVGGTGFYIKALIDGIESLGIPPDWELRKELSNYQIIELSNLLKKLDPEKWKKMNQSDRNNPRRLIRAIEIAKKIPNSPPKTAGPPSAEKLKINNLLVIGLRAPYRLLYQRIDQRVEERVEKGIIEEIQKLIKKGYNWENSALGATIGYKEWRPFFEGKASKEEIIQRWKFAEHAYARRQMTWFKKNKRICWFDIYQKNWQYKVEESVEDWYYGKTSSPQN